MIDTGGREFRRLSHPILVNGKKVRQVWVDGTMVYPEIEYPHGAQYSGIRDCDLIKVRGKTNAHITHSHDLVYRKYEDDKYPAEYYGPCHSPYSFSASFCAVLYPYNEYSLEITEGLQLPVHREKSYYYKHGSTQMEFSLFVDPWYGASDVPTFGIAAVQRRADGVSLTGVGVLDFKLKFHASPIPICGPCQFSDSAYIFSGDGPGGNHVTSYCYRNFNFDAGGAYEVPRIEPVSRTIIGPTEFNDRMLTRTGDFPSEYEEGAKLTVGLLGDWTTEGMTGVSLLGKGYPIPMHVTLLTKEKYGQPQETDAGIVHRNEDIPLGYIAFQEILYFGKQNSAPAWALTVSNEDLVF